MTLSPPAPPKEFLEDYFVKWVQVGEACFQTDDKGNLTSGQLFQYATVIGYNSGYLCILPFGQKPLQPPQEVLEDARFHAEEQRRNELICGPLLN
jgi:hypothetical protein